MKSRDTLRRRTVWLMIVVLVIGFGAVITRLAYLQLIKGEDLKRAASEQQRAVITLDAKRGNIYDVNGKILAQSASVWQVIMAPIYFTEDEQREYVCDQLSQILKVDKKELLEASKEQTYYYNVKRKIESDEKEKIQKLQADIEDKYGLSSVIALVDDYRRYYPYSTMASTVIGFSGDDGQGLAGVEYQYNDYLTGTSGRVISSRISNISDSITMPFEANQSIDATDGNSVVLTIDETIQTIAEKYLAQGIEENAVYNRAVCVIMKVETGEILAMATVEGFDLNNPFNLTKANQKKVEAVDEEYLYREGYMDEEKDYTKKQKDALLKKAKSELESALVTDSWRNKAISDTYYPGSVFKMVTLSMALQEKAVDEKTRVTCGGSFQVADKTINCTGSHGTQTYAEALINSCNPGFMQIGQKVGAEKFWEYYQGFGFSEKTGIDLPGESKDIFFTEDGYMNLVDLAVASFGQNFSITPIQMITAISAVANGGYIVQPHVVKQILDTDGNVVHTTSTQTKRQVISNSVSKEVTDILLENATTGSGSNGYVAGYRVAGKTGTSEKLYDSNNDGEDDYIASYGGFAPADDPQVACLVFFDTPTSGSYYGSHVAAPIFAQIMGEVLPYLEIDARYTTKESTIATASAGTYTGLSVEDASALVSADGFTVSVRGEGNKVLAQSPPVGSTLSSGGLIVLYTDQDSAGEQIQVPDFSGTGIEAISDIPGLYDVNIIAAGQSTSGSTCSGQSIKPGTYVTPGTVVTLTFTTEAAISD